jgi:hypothetical protein
MMVQGNIVFTLFSFSIICQAFSPSAPRTSRQHQKILLSTTFERSADPASFDEQRIGKPTGTSYLPPATVQRARENGSPIEKIKLEKDGTSAFVDVYEYAKKIRAGEMTWEEVEKADLDSVGSLYMFSFTQLLI